MLSGIQISLYTLKISPDYRSCMSLVGILSVVLSDPAGPLGSKPPPGDRVSEVKGKQACWRKVSSSLA